MDKLATPEAFAFAEELADQTWKNVSLLREDSGYDEVTAYLYDWSVILAVLGLDIFESVIVLLRQRRYRAAEILIRSLVDYDVRLRYYVVQSIKPRNALKNKPTIKLGHIKKEVDAVKDWDESDFTVAKKVSKYDPSAWPDDLRKELEKYAAEKTEPTQRSMPAMAVWLEKNECEIRGVLPQLAEPVKLGYRNGIAEWLNLSTYVHGDQAVVTDILEYKDGQKTGTLWRTPAPDLSRTLLFSAINHVVHLNGSIAILRGWAYGTQGAHNVAGRLWRGE
jgi:hypothetical protein